MTEYEAMEYADWHDIRRAIQDSEHSMMLIARKLMLTNVDRNLLELVSHTVRLQGAIAGQIDAVLNWYGQDEAVPTHLTREGGLLGATEEYLEEVSDIDDIEFDPDNPNDVEAAGL